MTSEAAEAKKAAGEAADSAAQAEDGAEQAQGAAEQAKAGARAAKVSASAAASAAAQAAAAIHPDDPLLDTAVRKIAAQATDEAPYGVPGAPTNHLSPFRIGFFGALGVLTAYGLVNALINVRSVLILLLISGFLAVGLDPAVRFFERRGLRRSRAVGVVLLIVLLAFVGFLLAIVPPIVSQTQQFVNAAPGYLADLQRNRTVADLDARFHIIKKATALVESPDLAANAFGGFLGVGKVVFGVVFTAVTVLTLTLYFMSSLPSLKNSAYRAVPRSRRSRVGLMVDDILERIGGYVAGALTIALCAGVTSFVLLLTLGIPYPIALALVVALTDLVPVVGATIGALIVTAVAFTEDVRTGLIVAVFYLLYQQIENYLLYPKIMKRSVDVSPLVTIVAVLVGGSLLGIVGALLAIPIAAAIQLVLAEVVIPRQDAT